jgi:hypothetical protein
VSGAGANEIVMPRLDRGISGTAGDRPIKSGDDDRVAGVSIDPLA